MRSIILFGASRGTGLEVARRAVASGTRVAAFVRESTPELDALGCEQYQGDVENRSSVRAVYRDAGGVDAVICTISSGPMNRVERFTGVENVVDEARAAGVRHLVLISSLGAGESRAFATERLLNALGEVLEEKTRAEEYLRNSGLRYTILRPGKLVDHPVTGEGAMVDDPSVHGNIARGDLAALILDCLRAESCKSGTFSVVDRAFLRG